jgi:hypothetical protein
MLDGNACRFLIAYSLAYGTLIGSAYLSALTARLAGIQARWLIRLAISRTRKHNCATYREGQ